MRPVGEKILVVNCGSSTVKADVFAIRDGEPVFLAKSLVDKISSVDAALEQIVAEFERKQICTAADIIAIGHRVVHGGSRYAAPVLIDDAVTAVIREMSVFAPLHNPLNLAGIEFCRGKFSVPQIAVFDTAFHQTMPKVSATYAIPLELAEKHGIRRYGFHGTSHEYVARECARRMDIRYEEFNAISLHLGNGASITAVRGGKSVDTSMGFTPLEGLVMGTRSGDLDPSIALYLQRVENLTPGAAEDLLNKKSGLLGLGGSNDMRDLSARAQAGDANAQLAIDIFCTRARKYLGAYLTWGKPHAVIFTGGIGENAAAIREQICTGLEHVGIEVDTNRNQKLPGDGFIGSAASPISVCVVATDEELMIARATLALLKS